MTDLVTVTPLKVNVDDRGSLFEILRCDDANYQDFGQVYISHTRAIGSIRGFHRHNYTWDHFCVISGACKFLFVDAEPHTQPSEHDVVYEVTVGAECPSRVDVPAGVWHGYEALVPDTVIANLTSTPYMGEGRKNKPDEERISPLFFVDAREMWQVVGR
jgi:dTDP-4-dehydrorhamnose 3,5-epimerase